MAAGHAHRDRTRHNGILGIIAELRFPDYQHRVGPVDVGAVEPDRFPDPQAGDGC
jgi:hypothetical protein